MAIGYSIRIDFDPFKEIKKEYNENNTGYFILLIFLLIVYLFCSAALNAYKVYCNVIYSPMARSLTDYFLNPFFNIYYFICENDFHKNYFYFSISEVISILMDFFCCVFNEYIILNCLGLEYDTKDAISQRAKEREDFFSDYNINDDYNEIVDDDNY